MITISLCMIVKNEEEVLARCLDSVKDAVDEIIIVDTGSEDNTKLVASAYTNKIYDFEWVNDFSAARNEAYAKATMDYQMWLDADDVVPPDSLAKLLALKRTLDPTVDIVAMKYHTHFDNAGNSILSTVRERLTKREKEYLWQDPVHECIPLIGNIFYSDNEIHHRKTKQDGPKDRNLNIYSALEASGKPFTFRQQYYFARELKDHGKWAKAADYFTMFLDGGKGWVEDNIASCYNLSICYKALGNEAKILPILMKSFEFDAPRAEICCEMGYYYKRAKKYRAALKWFQLAANLGEPDSIGFILRDYWGYIPNLEACVCSYALGEHEQAKIYNEKAAIYKPDALAVEMNRKFFALKHPEQ